MQLLYVIFFCTFVTCKTADGLPTIPEEPPTLLSLDINQDNLAATMMAQQEALIIIQSVQLRLHNPIYTRDEILELKKQLNKIRQLCSANDFLKTPWKEAASALDTRFHPTLETNPIARESYYTPPPTYLAATAHLQQHHPTAPPIPPPLLPPLVPMYSFLKCPLCRAKRSDESALRTHIQVRHPEHC